MDTGSLAAGALSPSAASRAYCVRFTEDRKIRRPVFSKTYLLLETDHGPPPHLHNTQHRGDESGTYGPCGCRWEP